MKMTEADPASPFAAWLVQARGEAGLTQDQLADETGIHVNTIKNLEAGKTKRASASVAAALKKRLGTQPQPEEVREEFDRHTRAFLDLVGAYLMAQPEETRLDRIFDLTRYLVTPK
jgi:transcriptional regulator with XRE-family HTH domain